MGQLVQFPARGSFGFEGTAATVDPWHRAPAVHPDQVEVTLEQDAEQSLSYALGVLPFGAWGLLNVAAVEAVHKLGQVTEELKAVPAGTGWAESRPAMARQNLWFETALGYCEALATLATSRGQRDIADARLRDLQRALDGMPARVSTVPDAPTIAELPF